jgi:hypothetical protein
MRLFQNVITYPNFRPIIAERNRTARSYAERVANFIDSCFINLHILKPVLDGDPDAFLAIGDLPETQQAWAREQGLPAKLSAEEILLAQIEHHRTEVFYNWDPLRFGNDFIRRLPGHVKYRIAWHASPMPHLNFNAHDLVLCNFPSILRLFEAQGFRTAWFAPAHDPIMDEYGDNADRPFDVVFVGGYSRHHLKRIAVLDAVARLRPSLNIGYFLDTSIYGRLADSPLGFIWPLSKVRRPTSIRAVANPPVFGREMYRALARAKVVLNGAIDMAGADRGNLRCWEAMGLGALMISDAGDYPPGMVDGDTFVAYGSAAEAVAAIERMLDGGRWADMAARGRSMVRDRYSKAAQWRSFLDLL